MNLKGNMKNYDGILSPKCFNSNSLIIVFGKLLRHVSLAICKQASKQAYTLMGNPMINIGGRGGGGGKLHPPSVPPFYAYGFHIRLSILY